MADYDKRLEWSHTVFAGRPDFCVSDFERNSSQTVFGKEVFQHIRNTSSTDSSELFWILGEDQWLQLSYWKEIDSYGPELQWIVLTRSSNQNTRIKNGILSRRLQTKTCGYGFISIPDFSHISSTAIREKLTTSDDGDERLKEEEVVKWIPESIRNDVIQTYRSFKNRKPVDYLKGGQD